MQIKDIDELQILIRQRAVKYCIYGIMAAFILYGLFDMPLSIDLIICTSSCTACGMIKKLHQAAHSESTIEN